VPLDVTSSPTPESAPPPANNKPKVKLLPKASAAPHVAVPWKDVWSSTRNIFGWVSFAAARDIDLINYLHLYLSLYLSFMGLAGF
jgi:hypothetical protein